MDADVQTWNSSGKEDIDSLESRKENVTSITQVLHEQDLKENVGLKEYVEAQARHIDLTPEDNKRIRWKIDIWVLPIMFITQILQFLDKTAINYANLFGVRKDLNLSGNEFNWLASLFYLGYLVAQFPLSYLFGKVHTGKLLGICTILWGIMILVFTWSHNFAGAAACRFFLGVFEAPITPGLTIAVGYWWTRSEAPLRYSIIYSSLGWAGVIGSLMGAGISVDHLAGPVSQWQLIFVVLGAVTTAWGFLVYFFLPDSPVDAKFFTHEERPLATRRVAANQVGIKSSSFKMYQIRHCLLDLKTWMIALSIFAAGIPNGVISNFSTELIQNIGFNTVNTALMDCVGNVFQVCGLYIGGFTASMLPNMRIAVMTAGNIATLIAAALLAYLPAERTWMRLVAFWFNNLQTISFSLAANMISVNMSGYTKKQFANALTFIAYCAGNIAGPQFVLQRQAPIFPTATKAMMVGFVGKVVFHGLLGVYLVTVNRQRDKEMRASGQSKETQRQQAAEGGMFDQTEFENKAFRYVL